MNLGKMRWVGHVALIEEIESCKFLPSITNRDTKCAYNILVGKFGGKRERGRGCNSVDVH
jgi:hypothetical protein